MRQSKKSIADYVQKELPKRLKQRGLEHIVLHPLKSKPYSGRFTTILVMTPPYGFLVLGWTMPKREGTLIFISRQPRID